jgi:hypothetical protein
MNEKLRSFEMNKRLYTEEKIIGVLKQMEAGRKVGAGEVEAHSPWLADGSLKRRLFRAMVQRVAALLVATVQPETAGCTIGACQASKMGPSEALNSWLDQSVLA